MINLLPPQEKKELLRGERYRLILILGTVVLLFFLSLFLILLSLKIYISTQAELHKIFVQDRQEELESSQIQNLKKEIVLINKELSDLNSFYGSLPNWTHLLGEIAKALPEGAYLTTLSLTPVYKENKFQVTLSGSCPDRDTLVEFKEKLETESAFQEIYFPPSSWVKPVDFSATFKVEI